MPDIYDSMAFHVLDTISSIGSDWGRSSSLRIILRSTRPARSSASLNLAHGTAKTCSAGGISQTGAGSAASPSG